MSPNPSSVLYKVFPVNVPLLSSCQERQHVGCRWRLWPGGHDGCGTSCGGAAPQAHGQPVEQSAVLNLLRNFRSSSSYQTAAHTCNSLSGLQDISCLSVLLPEQHYKSPFIFSFSCPHMFWKRTGPVMMSRPNASVEAVDHFSRQCYLHLTVAGVNVLSHFSELLRAVVWSWFGTKC